MIDRRGTRRRAPSLVSAGLLSGAALAAAILTGCSAPAAPATPSASGPNLEGTVTVYAAASLTESFGQIADDFEAAHPGVTVVLNFGGSSALAESILAGAPVDVFASASSSTMSTVTDGGLSTETPQTFAGNTLEIAVPIGNPGDITGLDDFADASRVIALCAPEVPCGAAAAKLFAAVEVVPAPDTLEQDVKAALTKVELGEVDAALVYATDVLAAGDSVEGIDVPEAADVVTSYPIVPLSDSPNPEAGAAFIEAVLSDDGQRVLADAGFIVP